MENCKTCQEIKEFEHALDQRAKELVDRVNELCRPTRERNKKRWEGFAFWAKLPLVGNVIYSFLREPFGLEQELDYRDAEWYKSEGSAIESAALKLEKLKAGHMEHWGDELVKPGLWNDPAGYYTPEDMITRRECYDEDFCTQMKIQLTGHDDGHREHYFVHLPNKYDFRSAVGLPKLQEGEFVMDGETKRIVPQSECIWFAGAYRHKQPSE